MEASGERARWGYVALLVLAGGIFISAMTPFGPEGLDAEAHVAVLAAVLAATLALALISRDPTWWGSLWRGIALGVGLSLLLYLWPPEISGRGDFQFRSAVAFAVVTASALVLTAGRGGFYTRWFGAAVGIVLPPVLLIGLFWVSCPSGGCMN